MDPRTIMQQVMQDPRYANNKQAQKVFDCYQRGDFAGIREIGGNIAREYGTTLEAEEKKFWGK